MLDNSVLEIFTVCWQLIPVHRDDARNACMARTLCINLKTGQFGHQRHDFCASNNVYHVGRSFI